MGRHATGLRPARRCVAGMPSHPTGDGEPPREAVRDDGGRHHGGWMPQRRTAAAQAVDFGALARRLPAPRFKRRNLGRPWRLVAPGAWAGLWRPWRHGRLTAPRADVGVGRKGCELQGE